MIRGALLLLAFVSFACGTTPEIRETPSLSCDHRVLDLNARLCAERSGVFLVNDRTPPCGQCAGIVTR